MILKLRFINFVSLFTLLLLSILHQSMAAFDKISPKMKRASRRSYHISVDYKQNWYRANHYCKYYNMDLVTAVVENVAEYAKLKSAIDAMNYGNETFWTAGTDLGSADEFYWATTGDTVDKTKLTKIVYKNQTLSSGGGGRSPGLSTAATTQTKGNTNCLVLKNTDYLRANCMSENYFICQSYEIVNEVGRRLIFS